MNRMEEFDWFTQSLSKICRNNGFYLGDIIKVQSLGSRLDHELVDESLELVYNHTYNCYEPRLIVKKVE